MSSWEIHIPLYDYASAKQAIAWVHNNLASDNWANIIGTDRDSIGNTFSNFNILGRYWFRANDFELLLYNESLTLYRWFEISIAGKDEETKSYILLRYPDAILFDNFLNDMRCPVEMTRELLD